MSPIENVVPNHVDVRVEAEEVKLRNKQDRSRDLFGVQLEVTSLLLEAERRKLSVLQKELQVALEEGGSIKAKEHQKQKLLVAIARIQAQHDHLDKEYREHALGALISAQSRGSGKTMQERERPTIAPKPIIATKPKYVPPVKIQQRLPNSQNSTSTSALHSRRPSTGEPTVQQHVRRPSTGGVNKDFEKETARRIFEEATGSTVKLGGEPRLYFDEDITIRTPGQSTVPNIPRKVLSTFQPGEYVQKSKRIETLLSGARRSDEPTSFTKEIQQRKESFMQKESYSVHHDLKEPLYPKREHVLQQKETLAQKAGALHGQFLGKKLQDNQIKHPTNGKARQEGHLGHMSTFVSEKCDKFYKKTLEVTQKPPNSPSTVCCSILSNAATECCGIINVTKKELISSTSKITKLDSVDSNSSDSGGFKDFIQPSIEDSTPASVFHHQRKISQPEFLTDRKLSELRPQGHQRKASQPDFEASLRIKQSYVPNAQALAQFLPQTEQKILLHNQKTDEARTRQPKPILSHGNIQQSTKKLEELLAQRLEKEKIMRKGGPNCMVDGASEDAEQKMRIQRQIQQKLHADLEQTVKQIQEIQNTEYRLPQNRKWNEVRTVYLQNAL